MAKYMLIGGGEIGRGNTEYETARIDEEIVKMTGKEKPNFLFIGLASSFSDSYYDTMKKIYRELGCDCNYLKKKNILNNPDIVENKIKNADIIYVGGGDTVKLLDDLKNYGIDQLLANVSENAVIAGLSAGAIMISKSGFSDSLILRGEANDYTFIEGLNFVDFDVCPHYSSGDRKEKLMESIKNSTNKVICLDDCCALKIENDKKTIISSCDNRNGYYCYYENGKFIEEKIK